MGISTYPYWIVPGRKIEAANPDDLPRNWFSQWANLAPEKPFAITETGYPAENLDMRLAWNFRVNIAANPEWQARYVAFMLEALNDLEAEFVAWFVPRDYDALYDSLQAQYGAVEAYKTARHRLPGWDRRAAPGAVGLGCLAAVTPQETMKEAFARDRRNWPGCRSTPVNSSG